MVQGLELDQDRRSRRDRRDAGVVRAAEEVRAAMAGDEIEILFQPQYACSDGRLIGAEALARWQRPASGMLGGDQLFRRARQAGQETALSRHIASRALRSAAKWQRPLRLSLNVTAADLALADFAETLAADVAAAGLSPSRLTVEITEQSLVNDLDRSAAQLRRLREHGIHVALDDFGTGFCNFSYLKHLPIHALKLDRSMIAGVGEDERDLAVLRGIMSMAVALDLEVVAEGIESEAQRAAVVREGCAVWQGFLGASPLSDEAFAALAA